MKLKVYVKIIVFRWESSEDDWSCFDYWTINMLITSEDLHHWSQQETLSLLIKAKMMNRLGGGQAVQVTPYFNLKFNYIQILLIMF